MRGVTASTWQINCTRYVSIRPLPPLHPVSQGYHVTGLRVRHAFQLRIRRSASSIPYSAFTMHSAFQAFLTPARCCSLKHGKVTKNYVVSLQERNVADKLHTLRRQKHPPAEACLRPKDRQARRRREQQKYRHNRELHRIQEQERMLRCILYTTVALCAALPPQRGRQAAHATKAKASSRRGLSASEG